MIRIGREIAAGGAGPGWWFGIWQPDHVPAPDGTQVPFEDADPVLLRTDPSCWTLHPGDAWHGFSGLSPGYCMLDPIKVTILTPGMTPDECHADWGIPAAIVARFLETRGVIPEKISDYSILLLFSLGVTKGKWGTLLSGLFSFKRLFDENALLKDVFPGLVAEFPGPYEHLTLPGLAEAMHTFMREHGQMHHLCSAFSTLPEMAMTPAEAYSLLVKGQVVQLPVGEMGDRVAATAVVPYPPGIPLLMPGERTGKPGGPILKYLSTLQEFDARFPGFTHEIHGVEHHDGKYFLYCIDSE